MRADVEAAVGPAVSLRADGSVSVSSERVAPLADGFGVAAGK